MNPLYRKAARGLVILFLITAGLLFGAAGTIDYWQAWLYLAVYFACSIAISVYLIEKDPALLARRMSGGPFAEKEPTQRIIMAITSLGFIALAIVPALDRRFGWSHVPAPFVIVGDLLVLLGVSPALGSWWGLPIVIAILPALIWRLTDEERFLVQNLAGYREYQGRVRYRLLPLVW